VVRVTTNPKENIFNPLLKNLRQSFSEAPRIWDLDALRVKDAPTSTMNIAAVASAKYSQGPERTFKG
jgi:hypothetical protein